MKIKLILVIVISIIAIALLLSTLPDSEIIDNTVMSFSESHYVIDVRDNPHSKGVKDVAFYVFDPDCACDVEYTLQMVFNTRIPEKNQEYIFSGFTQHNIYYVKNIKKV